ncbi:hypothetical protein ACFE04_030024 [Oxalis oulophora]
MDPDDIEILDISSDDEPLATEDYAWLSRLMLMIDQCMLDCVIQIACMDYPHPRHDCAKFAFSSTPHNKYCEQCHCYVCDSIAPCIHWGTGVSKVDHCHATDKEEIWKIKRKNFKLMKDGTPQTSTYQHVPHSVKQSFHCSQVSPYTTINPGLTSLQPVHVSRIAQSQASRPAIISPNQISRPTTISQNPISSSTAIPRSQVSRPVIISPNQISRPTTISQNPISSPTAIPHSQVSRSTAIPHNHITRSTPIRPCSSMTKQGMPNTAIQYRSRHSVRASNYGSQHQMGSQSSLGVQNHVIGRDRHDHLAKLTAQLIASNNASVKQTGLVRPTLHSNQYGSHNRRHGLQYSRSVTRQIVSNNVNSGGWLADGSPNTNSFNLYQTSHPNTMSTGVEPPYTNQPVPQPNNDPNPRLGNPDENFSDPEFTAYFNQLGNPIVSNQQPPPVDYLLPQSTVPRNESLPTFNVNVNPQSSEIELENWLLGDQSQSIATVTPDVLPSGPTSFDQNLLFLDTCIGGDGGK